jgi:CRP-like cAMP-binding protein
MDAKQLRFEFKPAYRRTDPATSRLAAERITISGRRKTQAQAVLDAVRNHPGLTAVELANASGIERYAVSRRLPELESNGLIVRGPARMCSIRNAMMTTWFFKDGMKATDG